MVKQTLNLLAKFNRLPKESIALGIVLVLCLALLAGWLWPRHLTFSYGQSSCVNQIILAPDLYKSTSKDGFRLSASGYIKLANISIASTKTCAIPVAAPKVGETQAQLSLFGLSAIAKTFVIKTSARPQASVKPLEKALPVALPLKLPLSAEDDTFSYKLAVADKNLQCPTNDGHIVCDIKKLSLQQGVQYPVKLERYFGNKKIDTIASKTVETLRAATVTASTIKPNEMIYAKPQTIQLTLDKQITRASAKLIKIDKEEQKVQTEQKINGSTIELSWKESLPRTASFKVIIEEVIASDSSSLATPYLLPFQTSGGPKVAGISVGRTKVPVGATAVITFDQPLNDKQDIAKAIKTTGGATITGMRGNQVTVATGGVPKCGTFGITINDQLLSSYDVSGGSGWQYAARTLCHTVGTIGASVKGRAIQAYYFGNGPTSVVYVGAIHGDELSTRSLMMRWIDELEANAQNIPADRSIVVIPALNPDGVASARRTNANNVDLNRNFNVSDWKKDITTVTNAPFPGGGGPAPMSEPETRALASLVSRLRPRLVLSYHSVGGVVAGNQAADSVSLAGVYSVMSGYRNVSGATSSTFEYQVTGTSDDYFAEKLGIPSILIELGSHSYHQFERNQKAMWEMMRR